MFSSTSLLIALSVIAACLAKPIKFSRNKCAYSSDPSVVGDDLRDCQFCKGYSNVALLQTDNWFQPIFLFCFKSSTSLNPQESVPYNAGYVS